MATPPVAPPRNPGETLSAYMERLEEFYAQQGAGPASGGGGGSQPTPLPQGAQPTGKPGQYAMTITVPNGQGGTNRVNEIYTVNEKGEVTNTTRSASGVGYSQGTSGSGGGNTTNYAVQNAQQKAAVQQQQGGLTTPPPNFHVYPGGVRAVDTQTGMIYTKHPDTGVWTTFGQRAGRDDQQAYLRDLQTQRQSGATPGPSQSSATTTTTSSPFTQTPTPMPNGPGTRTMSLPSSVNNVAIQNPNTGFNGFINRSEGQRAPANIGFGPATGANQILFSQNERGFTQADNPIRASYTVPENYNLQTGMMDNGFAGTTIGVTPGGYQPTGDIFGGGAMANVPTTVPINLAGNNVTWSAPDRSSGTGFVLNALPHSNIAMAQGRDFSNLTPAQQAVATWMLLDEQQGGRMSDAYRTSDGAFIFGGGGGGGFDVGARFAGGGRVASGPLGKPDLITNEPIIGVGTITGKRHFILGEDNRDRDRMPNPEAVYFPRPGVMDIVPMRAFAEGGQVATATTRYWKDLNDGSVFENSGGIDYTSPGVIEVGDIEGNPLNPTPQAPTPTTPPTTPVQNGPVALPIDKGGVPPPPPGSQPLPEQQIDVDPFDPNILLPWQQAAQRNAMAQDRRNRMQYRFREAGLSGPVALDVLQGDVPAGELAPNMYYDTSDQVNRVVNEIVGAQFDLRALGDQEDINPVMERASYLGNVISDLDRIRDLQFQRIGAEAGGVVPSASSGNVASWTAQLGALNEQLGAYYEGWRVTPSSRSNEAIREVANLERQARELENMIKTAEDKGVVSLDRTSIIDAQIKALQDGLPAGASEAGARTELARLQDRIQRNDKIVGLKRQVQNLRALNVPKLNGPIIPVSPVAA